MSRPHETRNFIIALIVIVAVFACGVFYLKAQAEHQNLLASVVNVVPGDEASTSADAALPPVVATSSIDTNSTTTIATSTPSSSAATINKKPTSTPAPLPAPSLQPTPTVTVTVPITKPAPTSTPASVSTPTPTSIPTSTATPAPAPVPAKPAAPASSPAISFPFTETNFSNDTNWKRTWGALTVDGSGALDLSATATTNGGTVYLANVANLAQWQDYTFTVTFDWNSGEQINLLSRYVDGNNYVLCEFDEEFLGTVHITLRQRFHGQTVMLATGDVLNYDQYGGTNLTASIETNGTQAICTFDNHSISNDGTGNTLNPPYTGTVGFTTWDGDRNNSDLLIKSVSVKKNY